MMGAGLRRAVGRALAVALALMIMLGLGIVASAADEGGSSTAPEDILEDFWELLPEEYKDFAQNTDGLVNAMGFESILGEIMKAVSGERGRVFSFFLFLFGSSVLLAVVCIFEGRHAELCRCGAVAVVAVAVYNNLIPIVSEVADALSRATEFFSGVSAVMTAATVAGGGSSTAAVQSVGMGLSISVVGALSEKVMMGLVSGMFALCAASSLGDGRIGSLSRCVKSVFTWGMGVLTALFAGAISLQSVVAGASDSAAMRAAKHAASGMIPIVGGTVSSALSTLASGVSYVKSVVGASVVAVLVTILLSPLVTLLLYKLCFFVCGLFLELAGADMPLGVMRSMSGALDALISVYALAGASFVFQTVLFMKGGVALL